MDKKRTIFGICLTLMVVSGWILLTNKLREIYPTLGQPPVAQKPAETPPTAPTTAATLAATTQSNGSTTNVAVTTPPTMQPGTGAFVVDAADPANVKTAVLGPATDAPNDATYAMRITLSPNGAGIDGVTLNSFRAGEDFKKLLKDRRVFTFQHPDVSRPDSTRPFSNTQVVIDGKPVSIAGAAWSLRSVGTGSRAVRVPGAAGATKDLPGQQAVYATTISQDGKPILELTKTYTLFAKDTETKGYELTVDLAAKNVSGRALSVKHVLNGPLPPPQEAARSPDRQLMGGYADNSGKVSWEHHTLDSMAADKPELNLTKNKSGHAAVWAGVASTYFDAFVLFDNPQSIEKFAARAERFEIKDAEHRPTFLSIETAAQPLQNGETATVPLTAHFGPRWREVLEAPHYADSPRDYDATLIITSGVCAVCTFGWLINVLVWLLNKFHWVAGGFASAGDWGIAIILLVALVRTLLHPITKKSQVQMMKLGKMGPALQKLKEKHGDDKEAFSKAQVELMKEQGMAPILGCLPMFLQMPIWIALWQALQSTFELRQAPFLWGATWIRDLSRPDYLVKFDNSYPLFFGLVLDGINLLPILMGVIFHIQARIQNSLTVATTPEQKTQQKMMMWMSTFLFPLFLYNGPSGLNLYILTSTLVGIIESKVIRDHIKQREAAEKAAAPVVVDARPTRAARKAQAGKKEEPDAPKTGLGGFLQKLQQRADEISQREQDKKKRK